MSLEPVEEKRIEIELKREAFTVYNRALEKVLEMCKADIMIGTSSEEILYTEEIAIGLDANI